MDTIRPARLTPEGFARYGTVARPPGGAPLAATEQFRYWSDAAAFAVDGETEIGYCTVYAADAPVDWMERHARTPEVLVPIDGPFLLPVMADGAVEVFRVEPGEAVVIGPGVWHSACRPVDAASTTYFVLFRRGTPHDDVEKTDVAPVALHR